MDSCVCPDQIAQIDDCVDGQDDCQGGEDSLVHDALNVVVLYCYRRTEIGKVRVRYASDCERLFLIDSVGLRGSDSDQLRVDLRRTEKAKPNGMILL